MKTFNVTFVVGRSKKQFLTVSTDDKWDIQKIRVYVKLKSGLEGEIKILKLEENKKTLTRKQKRKKHR